MATGAGGTAAGASVTACGASPTSSGNGGGSLLPSRLGRTAMAARTAAPIAAALPALDHRIRHPDTHC
jgi:hypothetical protein